MGVRSGPKLPNTDNLILCLDAFNTKSYAGEVGTDVNLNTPTANVHDYTGTGYGSLTEWSSDATVLTKTYDATIRTPLNDGYGATIISESGSAGFHHLSRFGGAEQGNHMVSFYFKPISNEITDFRVGMLNDTSNAGCSFNFVTGQVTAIGSSVGKVIIFERLSDGWWFCACDFNGRNGGWVGAIALYNTSYTGTAGRRKAYICGLQYSNKSYPTAYGDRSATDGWRDISGKGNHGTLTNMLGTATTHYKNFNVMLPTTNAYLDFDGTNDYVAVSYNATLNTPSGASFCFWFNDDTSGSSSQTLLSRGTSDSGANADNPRIELSGGTDNAIYFDWSENGADNYVKTVNNIFTKETWTHCVCTIVAGGRMEIYVNGNMAGYAARQNADAVENPLVNTSQDIQIGGATWIPRYFNGKMGCVQIYNQQLSHANIKQIYNAQKSRFGL